MKNENDLFVFFSKNYRIIKNGDCLNHEMIIQTIPGFDATTDSNVLVEWSVHSPSLGFPFPRMSTGHCGEVACPRTAHLECRFEEWYKSCCERDRQRPTNPMERLLIFHHFQRMTHWSIFRYALGTVGTCRGKGCLDQHNLSCCRKTRFHVLRCSETSLRANLCMWGALEGGWARLNKRDYEQ